MRLTADKIEENNALMWREILVDNATRAASKAIIEAMCYGKGTIKLPYENCRED